jgi:hypothetical protein
MAQKSSHEGACAVSVLISMTFFSQTLLNSAEEIIPRNSAMHQPTIIGSSVVQPWSVLIKMSSYVGKSARASVVVHQRQQLRFLLPVSFRYFTCSVSIEAEIRRNGVIFV